MSAFVAPGLRPARNPSPRRRNTWQQAASYVRQGLAIVRLAPGLYLVISLAYAMPALVAAYVAGLQQQPALWNQALTLSLPWVTIVLGAVVIMVAVGHHSRGRSVDFGWASSEALRWVPRYLWTNAHSSLIFWPPIGLLLAVRQFQHGASEGLYGALWWMVIISVALYLHTRTLLAPFLAVHADLPATLAVLEAWRLSGQHFAVCFATLVLGVLLPVGLPLGLLALGTVHNLAGSAKGALLAAAPDLIWAGIQAVRPVLIPALYLLYLELWRAELTRRQQQGAPRVPAVARWVLCLTQPLPKLGRWE